MFTVHKLLLLSAARQNKVDIFDFLIPAACGALSQDLLTAAARETNQHNMSLNYTTSDVRKCTEDNFVFFNFVQMFGDLY